ncbi:hypothetical protein B0T14DRAFT_34479 [Immersiella caudata]|uniref:Uncharacterized protein n=1 Tax=Immersiella caudata TaxID=314043 RepID=A0AA40CBW3_9PEZI|nr:hypothetical protein B0T14DRAFT_34479 [Immersiella caudata]
MPQSEGAAPRRLGAISPDQLASFVDAMLATKASDALMMHFAFKVVINARFIDEREMKPLWLPFARRLMDIAEDRNIPSFTRRLPFMIEAITEAFARKALATRPSREWRPAQRNWFCHCADCWPIRAFLASNCLVGKLNVASKAQSHIATRRAGIEPKVSCQLYGAEEEPDRIVVRKNITYEASALAEWETARRNVEEELDRLDQAKLEKLMGSRAKILGPGFEDDSSYDSDDTLRNAPLFEPPLIEPPPIEQPVLLEDPRTGPALPSHPTSQKSHPNINSHPPHANRHNHPTNLRWQTPLGPGDPQQYAHYQLEFSQYPQTHSPHPQIVPPQPVSYQYPAGPQPAIAYTHPSTPFHTTQPPVAPAQPPLNPFGGPPVAHNSAADMGATFGSPPMAAHPMMSPSAEDISQAQSLWFGDMLEMNPGRGKLNLSLMQHECSVAWENDASLRQNYLGKLFRARASNQPNPQAVGNLDGQCGNSINAVMDLQVSQLQREPAARGGLPRERKSDSPSNQSHPRVGSNLDGRPGNSISAAADLQVSQRQREPDSATTKIAGPTPGASPWQGESDSATTKIAGTATRALPSPRCTPGPAAANGFSNSPARPFLGAPPLSANRAETHASRQPAPVTTGPLPADAHPPATPPVAPEDEPGFKLYFDVISLSMRRVDDLEIPEEYIRDKLVKQWRGMAPEDRATYAEGPFRPAESPGPRVGKSTRSPSARLVSLNQRTPIKGRQAAVSRARGRVWGAK